MTVVAVHEWAAAQPTAQGRQIVDLEVHDGKVWAGYGDYGANTGPITVASYDPSEPSGFDAATVVDTEAVFNLRSIGDEVVAPATDPRSSADYAKGSPWAQSRPLKATHVFDSVTLTGTDLWMVGSKGADAVAWRSLDGGITWEESIRIAPPGGVAGDFSRFYFAAPLGGQLFIQAVSYSRGAEPTSLKFDGSTWTEGPSLLSKGGVGWKPQPFANGVVYSNTGQGIGGGVYYFDGTDVTTIGIGWDVEVADGAVWLLGLEGTVLRSTDLANWTVVANGPTNSRSLAVDGSTIYVGTADSTLATAAVVIADEAQPAPTTSVPETTDLENTHGRRGHDRSAGKCPTGWAKRGRC